MITKITIEIENGDSLTRTYDIQEDTLETKMGEWLREMLDVLEPKKEEEIKF